MIPSQSRPLSPNSPGVGKEIRDRLRLLQRTIDESIGPTYHSSYHEGDRNKLLRMFRSLELAEMQREGKINSHRAAVKKKAGDLQEEKLEKWAETFDKKHSEHATQFNRFRKERAEDRKLSAKKWLDKQANSKLKLHNDHLKHLCKVQVSRKTRDAKFKRIAAMKDEELQSREQQREEKRKSTEARLRRLDVEHQEKEQTKDLEREVRKVEWDKRLANVERDRLFKIRKAEAGRTTAKERRGEATAFVTASAGYRDREKVREARLHELEIRKKEEQKRRQEDNRIRRERTEANMLKNVKGLEECYVEMDVRSKAKDDHIRTMKRLRDQSIEEKRQYQENVAAHHKEANEKSLREKVQLMEERWSRRTERCFAYFTGERTYRSTESPDEAPVSSANSEKR